MPQSLLNNKIEFLKGVGPNKAALINAELNIFTFFDLINYFPFRYVDRTKISPIDLISTDDSFIQLAGHFSKIEKSGPRNRQRLEADFSDGSGMIKIIWFQFSDWLISKISVPSRFYIFGKPALFNKQIFLAHPEVLTEDEYRKLPYSGKYQPVYYTTEKLKEKGIDSKHIALLTAQALTLTNESLVETIPKYLLEKLKLPPINVAYRNVHLPSNHQLLDRSHKRFRFEEALIMQLRHSIDAGIRKKEPSPIILSKVGPLFNRFYNENLGFELTNAQKKVMKEIRNDLTSGHRMNRLLQGDVGSGKTVIAFMAALLAADNGFQACIMAPTEILAQQHFATITRWTQSLGIPVGLLTGNIKGKRRNETLKNTESGELKILIGTHALIEDAVQFKNVGLVIIDEQHRFGVMQRAKLQAKNSTPPHILVMTATPIPRTLAMTFYGDLDVSVINELPPGRKPVKTIFYNENQRIHALNLMKREIDQGHQVYVVYPLIKESEKSDLVALEAGYEALIADFRMPKYEVGILHGKMPQDEKDFVMNRFTRGLTNILVSTTVIEVGVDVPNASVMVIENAERFGLSQLHQLRGRVGRGASQSFCILIGGKAQSNDAATRIKTMIETNDGFKIAEVDLSLRGPGDLAGIRQSGDFEFKRLDLSRDEKIILYARNIAQEIVNSDPTLEQDIHSCLRYALQNTFKEFSLAGIA